MISAAGGACQCIFGKKPNPLFQRTRQSVFHQTACDCGPRLKGKATKFPFALIFAVKLSPPQRRKQSLAHVNRDA